MRAPRTGDSFLGGDAPLAALELALDAEVASHLTRTPGFAAGDFRMGRSRRLAEMWFAGADGAVFIARPGLAADPAWLSPPIGGMIGRQRLFTSRAWPGVALRCVEGLGVAGGMRGRFCRLRFTGPAEAVATAARALAADLPLSRPNPPASRLAAAVATVDFGAHSPLIPAARQILAAHAEAFLAALMTLRTVEPGADPERLHQARVASRRLRAVFAALIPLISAAAVAELRPELRSLARGLGRGRDWDVFLAGSSLILKNNFPDEAELAGLFAAARERRSMAYREIQDWLESARFRALEIALALLPQRLAPLAAGDSGEEFGTFAAALLARRARRVLGTETLAGLAAERLHRLRLDAKRLRYLGEAFARCFPPRRTRRYLRRLADFQEWLGAANDATTAARLIGDLAGAEGAPGFVLARGVVLGFAAAIRPRATAKAERALRRLRAETPFWV